MAYDILGGPGDVGPPGVPLSIFALMALMTWVLFMGSGLLRAMSFRGRFWAACIVVFLCAACGAAVAQETGNGTWDVTITAPPDPYAASFEWGPSSGVCTAIGVWANGWGTGATSCTVAPDGCSATFHAANGANPDGWDYLAVQQECAEAPPFDWTNAASMLQALGVALCAIALTMGYRAGDKV